MKPSLLFASALQKAVPAGPVFDPMIRVDVRYFVAVTHQATHREKSPRAIVDLLSKK